MEKSKTAVEFIENELRKLNISTDSGTSVSVIRIFEQAKEMEKEQSQKYVEFCVECDRKGMPLLDFKSWIEL